MKFIDTHSHIYSPEFDDDRAEMVQRAHDQGVLSILMPNVDAGTIGPMHQTEAQYPGCYAMMGLHPTSVKDNYMQEIATIEKHLFSRKYIGVGEIGIDLYWDVAHKAQQMEVFELQLKWAAQLQLPVVIHCREAFPEVFQVLDKVFDGKLTGVFHSFGGGVDELKRIAAYGTFKVGINGIVTFKKSTLPDVLSAIDPRYLVAETDAPYLAPHPYRGKRNEPAYVPLVVYKLAHVYGMSHPEMATVLEANARELFNL